jgi:hypothetical protein
VKLYEELGEKLRVEAVRLAPANETDPPAPCDSSFLEDNAPALKPPRFVLESTPPTPHSELTLAIPPSPFGISDAGDPICVPQCDQQQSIPAWSLETRAEGNSFS